MKIEIMSTQDKLLWPE